MVMHYNTQVNMGTPLPDRNANSNALQVGKPYEI